ncbi:hypothetical protein C4K04_3444 [Pseudomonas chlororaphis]|uniref:Uncharacterized protein n=1 Tax=Pseudomonas chlororaphis TaxID=587753 RepID=A0A3G7TS85_9PSED|nr:hypothetical protein C4K04_3444 [Pseudomonas chlororaphis]
MLFLRLPDVARLSFINNRHQAVSVKKPSLTFINTREARAVKLLA